MTDDEMVGWHHQLQGHEFEQTLGDDEGQGTLTCCSPWGSKESDTTGRLNNKRNTLLFSNNNFTKGKCACVVGGRGLNQKLGMNTTIYICPGNEPRSFCHF